jgi:hypothetical protein
LRDVFAELFEAVSHFDGRAFRTLPLLFLRPGRLSAEWKAGRRTRFVSPTNMFFFSVFLLFLVPEISGRHILDIRNMLHITVTHGAAGQASSSLSRSSPSALSHSVTSAVANALSHADYYNMRVESLASKLVLLMAPILAGIFACLLFFRRTHNGYDHVVAALYELSWLSLALAFVSALPASVEQGALAILFVLVPVHLILHLRGFYRLKFVSAVAVGVGTMALSLVAAWVLIIAITIVGIAA